MSVIHPPSTGPTTGAIRLVMVQMVSAAGALLCGKLDSSSDCDNGTIGPATAPCKMRNAMRAPMFGAIPHKSEASVNRNTLVRNTRTGPKRWASQPVSGSDRSAR